VAITFPHILLITQLFQKLNQSQKTKEGH